jgi:endonuclease/exonuclease/phosphatase (EEP) superfamily protein YafD
MRRSTRRTGLLAIWSSKGQRLKDRAETPIARTRTPRWTAVERSAFALGGLCLSAGVAAQGGRVSEALDLLSHFAPFWLGGALIVVVLGCLVAAPGRRRALIAIGLVGAIAALALMVPEFIRPIPRVAPGLRTLRVIQFNAWDENLRPEATAIWIARERPDLVLIEEVEPRIKAALVARGFVYTHGFGHIAIFSRAASIGGPTPLAPAEWRKMPPFARATFGSGTSRLTVVAAHVPQPIYLVAGPQRRMLATFLNRLDRDHLIVGGDFNLTPWSFALRGLDRSLGMRRVDRAEFSWPGHLSFGGQQVAALPMLPIDHVYVGAAWRLVSLRRGPALGSDHFPLEVVLTEVR